MIVKNEERCIARCLDSFKGLYDELIIVDTGSTDNTKEICRKYTNKIYDFKWCDDFSAARNFALEKCTHNVIGWCDADECFEGDCKLARDSIESLLVSSDVVNILLVFPINKTNNLAALQYYRACIWKHKKEYWLGKIHELIKFPLKMKCSNLDGYKLLHKKVVNNDIDRNLRILKKIIKSEPIARDLFYYARELEVRHKCSEAIVVYLRYITVSTFQVEKHRAMCSLACCFWSLKDKLNAQKWALRAILLDQNYSEPYNLLGHIEFQFKNWILAKAWFLHAINLPVPPMALFDYVPERTYIPLEWLAICEWRLDQKKEALQHHKAALKFCPNNDWLKSNSKWFFND